MEWGITALRAMEHSLRERLDGAPLHWKDDPSLRGDTLQLRLWFAKTLLDGGKLPGGLFPRHCWKPRLTSWTKAQPDSSFHGFDANSMSGPRAESDRAIQILLDRLRLRTPDKLYRCPGTGTLWPRTILGWAPLRGCLGSLHEITHAEADEDRRWARARRELRESAVFSMGLWGEEHSAQLSPTGKQAQAVPVRDGARNLCPRPPRWNLASTSAA